MKIIEPSYEIQYCPDGKEALIACEQSARVCYKSEDRIDEGSAERMVRHLIRNGHHAMLEFAGYMRVKFTSNRGFTHEIVRHRLCSFGQENTRYCNYSKGKFGSEITVCSMPGEWYATKLRGWPTEEVERQIAAAHQAAEKVYNDLVEHGVPAELAREVLPIGLKAEIVVMTNLREWRHIFQQRCSKKAHPRMRQLMISLLRDVGQRIPVLFDDLVELYCSGTSNTPLPIVAELPEHVRDPDGA